MLPEAYLPAMAEFDLSIYEQRIQSFRASDHDRERLVSELLHKHTTLLEEYRILKSDFASERDTRRYYQKLIEDKQRAIADREKLLANQEQEIDNNSFVLALIDGDGVIFQDALLQAGSNGGSEAASRLQSVILDYLGSIYNNSGNWSIMVQIYVSLDKLAQKLASVGLLRAPYELRSFAQSFSLNQPLFSIIDVGQGKERADHKIKEMLRTFSDNPTCRHIFFGGCHDAGYLINLDQYKHNAIKASHITLLESTPAFRGFADLPNFKRTRFDEVFRSEHLPDGPPVPIPQSVQTPVQTPVPGPIRSLTNKSSPSASPKTTPATISPTTSSPITAPSAPSVSSVPSAPSAPPAPSAPSAPSALSSASNQTDQTPTDPSWVNVGKAGSATGNINITSTSKKAKKVKKEYIYYNKDQQRLDEPLPRIDREAADSLERRRMAGGKKLCNNYHLNDGKCDQGKFCQFQHDPKLSAEEKVALKYKTRTLPCRNRYCENFKCYLGHQCSMERDYGECRYPDSCNLRSTHGMDKKKYSRWDQEGNEELAPGVVHAT